MNYSEAKIYFSKKGHLCIGNEAAKYQFVKTDDGLMYQYYYDINTDDWECKYYNSLNGFCKAISWRAKRG